MNHYVRLKTADLYRPNARFIPERQRYQVLTPFGKLGYSQKFRVRQQVLEGLQSERRLLLSLAVIAGAVGALGAGLATEAARWLWDAFLAVLSSGWATLAAWWNS